MKISKHFFKTFTILGFIVLLAGCGGVEKEAKYPTGADRSATDGDIYAEAPSIFGSKGLRIAGSDDDKRDTSSITVNSYLWRASLDTVSFMPLASVDPFGGVILTDWYAPAETPNEQFKLNVFIMDRSLRSDGVEVKVFRQVKRSSQWVNSAVDEDTATKLEDTILTKARQMRVAELGTIE